MERGSDVLQHPLSHQPINPTFDFGPTLDFSVLLRAIPQPHLEPTLNHLETRLDPTLDPSTPPWTNSAAPQPHLGPKYLESWELDPGFGD